MSQTVVAALYQFVALPDCQPLRDALQALCEEHAIRGTLLLASEGINGTVAGSRDAIDALRNFLRADGRFNQLEYKEALHDQSPFLRLKVKVKKEIVTMGMAEVDPRQMVGRYADVETWNRLIDDPETLVIDTRNRYEVAIGRFRNAVSPETEHFREFPGYVRQNLDPARHKRVAMYCTGGIRCEKASHYLLSQGFKEVYHLKGGILKYLEEVRPEENRWQGECFVFDERVAVDHALKRGEHVLCRACRHPVSAAEQAHAEFEAGVSCPHCYATQTPEKRARARERQRQMELAAAHGRQHLGPDAPGQ